MKKILSIIIVLVIFGAGVYWLNNKEKDINVQSEHEVYSFMQDMVSGHEGIELEEAQVVWRTNQGSDEYAGYSFTVTGSGDEIAVAETFESKLRAQGFVNDPYNSGDATVRSTQGYVRENIMCISEMTVLTPIEEISDDTDVIMTRTVSCAAR